MQQYGGLAGIVDLVVVLLFRPVERIHELMADFSQITIITAAYQEQVGLKLLELDVRERNTLNKAAVEINTAATKYSPTNSTILRSQKRTKKEKSHGRTDPKNSGILQKERNWVISYNLKSIQTIVLYTVNTKNNFV